MASKWRIVPPARTSGGRRRKAPALNAPDQGSLSSRPSVSMPAALASAHRILDNCRITCGRSVRDRADCSRTGCSDSSPHTQASSVSPISWGCERLRVMHEFQRTARDCRHVRGSDTRRLSTPAPPSVASYRRIALRSSRVGKGSPRSSPSSSSNSICMPRMSACCSVAICASLKLAMWSHQHGVFVVFHDRDDALRLGAGRIAHAIVIVAISWVFQPSP